MRGGSWGQNFGKNEIRKQMVFSDKIGKNGRLQAFLKGIIVEDLVMIK